MKKVANIFFPTLYSLNKRRKVVNEEIKHHRFSEHNLRDQNTLNLLPEVLDIDTTQNDFVTFEQNGSPQADRRPKPEKWGSPTHFKM